LLSTLAISTLLIVGLHYLYKPVTTGSLHLKNVEGEVEIIREVDTGIPHIFATTEKMAIYA